MKNIVSLVFLRTFNIFIRNQKNGIDGIWKKSKVFVRLFSFEKMLIWNENYKKIRKSEERTGLDKV